MRIGRCYKCNKYTLFTKKRKALCVQCHKECVYKAEGKYPKHMQGYKHFTTYKVREQRRRLIKKVEHCQLCGTKNHLTVHHIGGSTEIGLTVLCERCHRAYESWHKREMNKLDKEGQDM